MPIFKQLHHLLVCLICALYRSLLLLCILFIPSSALCHLFHSSLTRTLLLLTLGLPCHRLHPLQYMCCFRAHKCLQRVVHTYSRVHVVQELRSKRGLELLSPVLLEVVSAQDAERGRVAQLSWVNWQHLILVVRLVRWNNLLLLEGRCLLFVCRCCWGYCWRLFHKGGVNGFCHYY